MAVPTTAIARGRGAKGVPKGLSSRNLHNSFAKSGKSGDLLIFQRGAKATKGAKKKSAPAPGHLKLAYVIKQSTKVSADVPFESDFARVMRREMPRQFSKSIEEAMKTAFKK